MPQTLKSSSLLLSIHIDDGRTWYSPGDGITGRIVRAFPILTPEATVKITMHGRVKSHLVRLESGSTYRSQFRLIDHVRRAQTLHDGPVHIPSTLDHEGWPFTIRIPTHVDDEDASHRQKTFIPQGNSARRTHILPPSYIASPVDGSGSFVEYYLKATFRGRGQGQWHSFEAILPIRLCAQNQGPPLTDWGLTRFTVHQSVTTQRLMPGMESAVLSTSQRLRKLVQSSSVPVLRFSAEVEAPSRIQLEHPDTVPFRIRVVPEWEFTSEVVRNVPQTVQVLHAWVKIRQICEVKCEGTRRTYEDSFSEKVTINLIKPLHMGRIRAPFGEEQPSLDLGRLANLRIDFKGPMSNRQVGTSISPSFVTYNLKVRHTLGWVILLRIGGQECEIRSRRDIPVVIVPPSASGYDVEPFGSRASSESWISPLAEEEPPLSFEEVVEEDRKAERENLARVEERGEPSGAARSAL